MLGLANGQLAASAGTILAADTSPHATERTVNVTLTNTSSSQQETILLTVSRAGGTARRKARIVLGANEFAKMLNIPLDTVDSLAGETTHAATVDYDVSASAGGLERLECYDASGTIKSGAGGISGNLTLSDDLNLKTSEGTTFEAWDASDISLLWGNSPSRINSDPSVFHEFWEDFCHPASATASDLEAFTSNDDSGTGTNAFQDAAGGIYNIVTAAADNDYHAMSTVLERFLFAAGKKLWFEARFKLAEATTNESAWWFGLTDTLTTGGFQANAVGPLASYDGALVWKDEATMTIDFETSNAGTQATTSAMATFVTNTWTRVGFYFDGTATTAVVTPYYDVGGGVLIAGTPQNITLSGLEEMHLVFGVKAGPTAGAETLQVDYVRCLQLR